MGEWRKPFLSTMISPSVSSPLLRGVIEDSSHLLVVAENGKVVRKLPLPRTSNYLPFLRRDTASIQYRAVIGHDSPLGFPTAPPALLVHRVEK